MTGQQKTDDGYSRVTLRTAADTPIRRHIKIHARANPFDPAWESYFENRQRSRMPETLAGRSKLIRLWINQQGLCCVCSQGMTEETG